MKPDGKATKKAKRRLSSVKEDSKQGTAGGSRKMDDVGSLGLQATTETIALEKQT